MRVQRFSESLREQWDDLVDRSKNGTFLLKRAYVEYHADRFPDWSLVVLDSKDRLVGVLPATASGQVVSSHRGLTYGGLVVDETMTTPRALEAFDAVLTFLKEAGITALEYRGAPSIYHRMPADEDRLALLLAGARGSRCRAFSVLATAARGPVQERRARGVKRARARGFEISPCTDLAEYWRLLSDVLDRVHGARPVHTLDEMAMLRSRFPANIVVQGAFLDGRLHAGVCVYETDRVAKFQYIAADDVAREHGALDLLFATLLDETYSAKSYVDFGTSDDEGGLVVKKGLTEQKEGFGARAIVQEEYVVSLADWVPGALAGRVR